MQTSSSLVKYGCMAVLSVCIAAMIVYFGMLRGTSVSTAPAIRKDTSLEPSLVSSHPRFETLASSLASIETSHACPANSSMTRIYMSSKVIYDLLAISAKVCTSDIMIAFLSAGASVILLIRHQRRKNIPEETPCFLFAAARTIISIWNTYPKDVHEETSDLSTSVLYSLKDPVRSVSPCPGFKSVMERKFATCEVKILRIFQPSMDPPSAYLSLGDNLHTLFQ
ncbi:hypothetical protein MDAP_002725 [Mitosporidium daphniae]|uniref:Uncharacterized protein n=1 Tax=Mitosporidium daphniae TaxID=1485682 RepID=A0A098VTP3_9MICR|nr:uncharacterized protein DI09_1p540 [Mitosporidium daphniae]KGG52204.1 hypothetical protein DI09_1p540 [Mitosporidium daphniae]|eukprot:XP_013238631.1 uncharacterized protein DI09_1p540 [Mitosporidium daphniae]